MFDKVCKTCKNILYITNKKATNGAYVFIDKDNFQCIGGLCRECRNRKLRKEWNSRNSKRKKIIRNYERFTKKGYLMRKYRNMLSRVKGIQKLKKHLYAGKKILDKETFYQWSMSNKSFHMLWDQYFIKNMDRKFAPSIDRIDPKKGYEINNIQWITHSENSSRSNKK
jgi:hypothetical protein